MSESAKPKMTPGILLGFMAGAALGFFLLCLAFALGIAQIGEVHRQYPQVIMGFITLCLIGAAIGASMKAKSGGGG